MEKNNNIQWTMIGQIVERHVAGEFIHPWHEHSKEHEKILESKAQPVVLNINGEKKPIIKLILMAISTLFYETVNCMR